MARKSYSRTAGLLLAVVFMLVGVLVLTFSPPNAQDQLVEYRDIQKQLGSTGDLGQVGQAHRVQGVIHRVQVNQRRVKDGQHTYRTRSNYCPIYSFVTVSGEQREYTDSLFCDSSRDDFTVGVPVTLIYSDGSSFVFQESHQTLKALEANNGRSGTVTIIGWGTIGFGVVLLIVVWRPARRSVRQS